MNSIVSLKRAFLVATLTAISVTMLPLSGRAEPGSTFYLHAGYTLDDHSPSQAILSVLRMSGTEYYVWKTRAFATEQRFAAGTWTADLWMCTDVVTGDRPTQFAVAVGT